MTVPGNSLRLPASTCAAPSSTAVWPSWPQACITPTFSPRYSAVAVDWNGRSACSVTGSASMSARSATVGPGLPPRSTPTTPVCATPVRTSRPSLRNCSATAFEVRNSRLPSSGFWWKSRRQAMTCGITAVAAASSWASVTAASADTAAAASSRTRTVRRTFMQ